MTLEILSIRKDSDDRDPPTEVMVVETAPAGWTISGASAGGTIAGDRVSWTLSGAALRPISLAYTLRAAGDEPAVSIGGRIVEKGVDRAFEAGRTRRILVRPEAIGADGFIRNWLLLGPSPKAKTLGTAPAWGRRSALATGRDGRWPAPRIEGPGYVEGD